MQTFSTICDALFCAWAVCWVTRVGGVLGVTRVGGVGVTHVGGVFFWVL